MPKINSKSNLLDITKRIMELEKSSRMLELSAIDRKALNHSLLEFGDDFISSLSDQQVFNEDNRNLLKSSAISEAGTEPKALIEALANNVFAPGINAASGGHMGYIPGGGLYPSALADYLAAVTNRYAGIFYAAPGAVALENRLIDWMNELMEFPKSAVGNLTSGGSISILTAVVSARDALSVEAKDFSRCTIYLTGETHHALQKALRIAGLGSCKLRIVPIDNHWRMIPDALNELIKRDKESGLIPLMINATIGTTNTGAVDPLYEISMISREQDVWLHIDAAYGGFFKLVTSCQHYFKGIEHADSIVLDPHKSLFLPFGVGAVLIKNPEYVFTSHHYLAPYMQDTIQDHQEVSPADISPELTKHFRGLRMWLPLHLFGLRKFRDALEEKRLLSLYFHTQISSFEEIEVGPKPQLSIAVFRIKGPDDLSKALLDHIRKDGRIFLSSTTIDEVFWIRICILSFRTHQEHVDTLLDIIRQYLKV